MGGKKKATIDGPGESSEAEKATMKEMLAMVSYITKLHKEHERIIAHIQKVTYDDFKQTGEIIDTLVQQVTLVQQQSPSESRELVLTLNKTFRALAERRDPATTDNLFTTCKLPQMPSKLMATYTKAGTSKPKSDDEEDSDDSDDDEGVATAPANTTPAAKAPAAKAPVQTKPKAKAVAPKPKPKVNHDDVSSSDEDGEAMRAIQQMPPGQARMNALLNEVATKTPTSMQPAATAWRGKVESAKRKRERKEAEAATPVELLRDAPGLGITTGASSSRDAPSGAPPSGGRVFSRDAMRFAK